MVTDNRPLSPHLQVYRPQLTSTMSIAHRLTGVLISLGMVVIIAWVVALAAGPEAYATVTAWLGTPVGLIALFLWTAALLYHLLNGIRHLLWDAGWLLELKGAYASGWTVLVLTVVLTVIVWGGLL
ncbi:MULTISPECIES: succinate dehydrogenase, cytochrome b556 subunit [unclassified Wenzhouxiangella]|uniref:succinate dehydrogenase, cytochrome b556 subunit n=1 Tax=unclassified Wenzhouxiangella TaxID=2613841 RepID=UPI000E327D0B|nr:MULTISPECIES: succinate dehydrogenase, cytochrome b556 subunit [unclassified Wenzhouxiangella]RFF28225.1 succinate dehydrogenase, cytochrome b556 subunit [Wenzhouxiangella sp. 15181]RFP67900.1 succinate dehydrogenase, cytochrome b556 subunit [Wenzhouxiangella sp. 15190]